MKPMVPFKGHDDSWCGSLKIVAEFLEESVC